MKIASLLILALLLAAPLAQAQVPRNCIAEDCTATWCVYCPDAYAGLEIMKNRYDATEFTSVRYYDTSGALGTTEIHNRLTGYYGVSAFPTVFFDGSTRVVGGGSSVASGAVYDPIVQSEIGKPSPIAIRINSVNITALSGSINYDVMVEEDIADISQVKIRTLLVENNVPYSTDIEQDVTRDILPDVALTVSQTGQVQNVVQNFAVDPTWKPADLWLAAFVQDDHDKSILQANSTRPMPAYSLRFWTKGTRAAVVPSNSDPYEFQDFAVFNMGTNPDIIRVTLDPGTLPSGWSCAFTDGVNDYSTYLDLSLSPGQGQILRMKVTPGATGYATPSVVLTSNNLPGVTRTISYTVITDDVQVLLVDDDGGLPYDQLHAAAITNAGRTYGVWPADLAQITAADLAHFTVVDWECGLSYPTLDTNDRAALAAYLNGGGRLFLSGQDIGWELADPSSYVDPVWYSTYLHADYVGDNAGTNTVNGLPGDPISAGMTLSLTPSLNPYPDYMNPHDAAASVCFEYSVATRHAALKVNTGVYRVVYLGFGYEAINSEANRFLLMQRVLTWLGDTTGAPDVASALAEAGISAFPNPAPGAVTLRYALPFNATPRVEIYRPDGGLVRALTAGPQQAGTHTLRWDGRDNAGAPAGAGVYFYRLQGSNGSPSGKLVLTR